MSKTQKLRSLLVIITMACMFSIAVPFLHAQTPSYDEFDDGIIDPAWTFQSYDGDYREQNGFIEIDSGSRDAWTNQYDPTWIYQEIEGDFDVYTRIAGCTALDANYKNAGILVEENSADFLRIVRVWDNGPGIQSAHITNSSLSRADHVWVAEAEVIYLRVKRVGSDITTYYSENGVNWVLHLPAAPFQTLGPVKIGLFATHIGATQFTARFDYFRNHLTNPINYVPVVTDDFTGVNNDLPDPDKWTISWREQTPPNFRIYEGKLEASNQDDWRDCRSRYYVKGDFDVVVDFNFPIYSTQEGWGAGIVARALQNEQNKFVLVDKGISAGQERYRMYSDGADRGVSVDAAQSGRLRLTRIGDQFRAYKWDPVNQAWIVYSIYTPADFGESAFISLWMAHWGGNPNTVIDFDNFGIVTGDASVYIDQPITDLFEDGSTAGFWNWQPDGGGNHRELEREHEIDSGSGDLWDGTYDPCWLYQPIKGDFDVYTRVEDVESGDYRRAGLHFRVDDSNWMGCWLGNDGGLSVSTHHTVDGISQAEKTDWPANKGWLRISRVDSDIAGYYWDVASRQWIQLAPPSTLSSALDGQIGILANHPFSSQFTAKFRLFANYDFWHEDHFNDAEIDPMWNIYQGDHASVPGEITQDQGWLHLTSSNDGGVYLDDSSCTRALARISGDFDIKVRLQVASLWDDSQHFNFVYVHDDANWAGFQRVYGGYNMLEFGHLTYDSYEVIGTESWDRIHFYLRLKKAGTIITGYESEDGLTWRQMGSYDESWVAEPGHIGFYAGQGELDASYQFSAKINWILEEVTSTEVANNLVPTAVAQADVTSGPAPLTVNFDGSASTDPENQPLEYVWVFGEDTGFSEETSPTHTYENPGVYNVRLTVVDDADQMDEDSITITVVAPNTPPVADAGPDQDIVVNEVISLSGSASDPDGDAIVLWLWTVETQPTGSDPFLSSRFVAAPEFSSATPGVYTLSLVVNDNTDESSLDYVTIQVRENLAPTAVAQPEAAGGPAPLTVQFDGSTSSDPENRPLAYSWSFGDGSESSASPSPEHIYSLPGIYTARLLVTDHAGLSGEDTVIITVVAPNIPPVADAGPDQDIVVNEVISLPGSASDPDGDAIVLWLWTVESQPTGSDPFLSSRFVAAPEFSAATPGVYTLSLVVDDNTDESLLDYVTIQVRENLAPTAVAQPEVAGGPAPLTVQFDGSTSSDPENRPLAYSWSFGDGSESSASPSPEHIYSLPGTYTARLLVTDHAGLSGEDTVTITVIDPNGPPTASPTATPNTGSAPLSVTFSANASDPDGDDLTYLWDFGDGTTSIEPTPSHMYPDPDTYTVALTVSDGELDFSSSLTVVVQPETGFSVRYARMGWSRKHNSIGSIILLVDFDFAVPAPEDMVRVTFDGMVLCEEPFSNFKRSYFNRKAYRLYRKNQLVRFDFRRKVITVFKWNTDISMVDNEDGVEVELSTGSVAAAEKITMSESYGRSLVYRRPR